MLKLQRGLAGTVLVYKIAGALAERRACVDDVHSMAEFIASHVGTIGVSLGHTHVCTSIQNVRRILNIDETD